MPLFLHPTFVLQCLSLEPIVSNSLYCIQKRTNIHTVKRAKYTPTLPTKQQHWEHIRVNTHLMYLSLQVSRNFSSCVGVILSNWYKTLGWKENGIVENATTYEDWKEQHHYNTETIYLCCAIVINSILVSSFFYLLRNTFDEFFNLLKSH